SFPVGEDPLAPTVEQNPWAGMGAAGGSAPAKSPAISATPSAKKPAAPPAPSPAQASKGDNIQGSEAVPGAGKSVSEKVAAIVKDPKRKKWLAIAAAGVAAVMLFFTCIGVTGLAWYLKGRGSSGGGLFARGDAEDPNLPPIDTTDIEPVPVPQNHNGQLAPEI